METCLLREISLLNMTIEEIITSEDPDNVLWSDMLTGAYQHYYGYFLELDDGSAGSGYAYLDDVYGYLYNWYSVDDDRGICPENWSVPSAEDFTNWVDSEFDVETLEMVQSKISERISFLDHLIGTATRKEIKGFRK